MDGTGRFSCVFDSVWQVSASRVNSTSTINVPVSCRVFEQLSSLPYLSHRKLLIMIFIPAFIVLESEVHLKI